MCYLHVSIQEVKGIPEEILFPMFKKIIVTRTNPWEVERPVSGNRKQKYKAAAYLARDEMMSMHCSSKQFALIIFLVGSVVCVHREIFFPEH